MEYKAWALTDVGNVRENNEDSHLLDLVNGVFVVADGVGGSQAGEVASEHLCKRIGDIAEEVGELARAKDPALDREAREKVFQVLLDHIHEINSEVYGIGKEINPTLPSATTCDAMVMSNNCAFIAHVGDSRVYLFRAGQIFRITEDHTFAEQLKREAVADERILERFRNVLTRSIGGKPQVEIDALFIDLQPGDRVLMCSDGVTDYLSGSDLLEFSNQKDGEELLKFLIREAKDRGGADNITALLVEIVDSRQENTIRDQSFDTLRQADILGKIELFEGLGLRDLIKVLRIVYERNYTDGQMIMTPGEPADCMYVVAGGRVELTSPGQTPRTLKEGQHFGALALVSEEIRESSAIAKGQAMVLVVPGAKFKEIVEDDSVVGNKLLWNLLRMMAEDIRVLRKGSP
ncbi:cyclic nucleotide-binding domain-containing protein [Microvenator marinus]|jgi:serine/threonine protein phosphatase PrpC|uniref:Cyclic nucleotide-binding domain-containing protein n=1 Tax=Microvenator marinus TaxID=2600177 RepID=A0A5B8XS24_9DELT|nr:cyclic nucleotide-binding domain-containing protein [Microvenator marinus]QED28354.1 cyclic nucleotide-binding domain-containing protein [Microvenator marinus]